MNYLTKPGTYLAEVGECHVKPAKDDTTLWVIRYDDIDTGETLAWDTLKWDEKGRERIEMVLEALGRPNATSPMDIIGARAMIQVRHVASFEGMRASIPYRGVKPVR